MEADVENLQRLKNLNVYLQKLIERLKTLGYQNLEGIRIIPVESKEDIEREIRNIAQKKQEQFIDAVNSGVENPTETILNLSKVIFVAKKKGDSLRDMVITNPTVVWDRLEFPINVAIEWQRKRSFFKPNEEISIEKSEDSKIPWVGDTDTKPLRKQLPQYPFPHVGQEVSAS